MIVSLLLAGFTLISLSLGDDTTVSASDDVPTTTAAPTYWLLNPKGSPTYGLNQTVQFTWEAEGYTAAFYVCHSSISTDFSAHTNYWITSSSYSLPGYADGDESFYDVASLGQSLSQNFYTDWPATCFFGMRDKSGNVGHGDIDFFITTSIAASSTLTPGATTTFVTASSTAPAGSIAQPTTTAWQPPPIATIPEALPEPEDNRTLPGGSIAGIAIGSVSGVLILIGLIMWLKAVRRRASNPQPLLSGFAEAVAPIKNANEPATSRIERGEGVVHEMSAPDPVTVFELESPPHDGPYEMPQK